jgi:hypothetical protein
MIEEAEKNASVDKTKKSLVSIVYEYDNLLSRIETVKRSRDFSKGPSERARQFFRKVVKTFKANFKRKKFTTTGALIDKNYLTSAFEALAFDALIIKIKKPRKSLVIDITDDGE